MNHPENIADSAPESATLHIVLEGDDAKLEDVPVQDIMRLIDGTIRSISCAAELVVGRGTRSRGRPNAAVKKATAFRLVAIQPGSINIMLRGPKQSETDMSLPLDDEQLTDLAIKKTLDALEGDSTDVDPSLASRLTNLGDDLGVGERYETVRFAAETKSAGLRTCHLNQATRARLRQIAHKPKAEAQSVVSGTLVAADFERSTARLRTSANRSVKIAFTADEADAIQQLLRQKADLDGVVTFDPETQQAESVEVRSIESTHQQHPELCSELEANYTLEEIAAQQGVTIIEDPSKLHIPELTEEEIDAFCEALGL